MSRLPKEGVLGGIETASWSRGPTEGQRANQATSVEGLVLSHPLSRPEPSSRIRVG